MNRINISKKRPYKSRIGARISPQSQPIGNVCNLYELSLERQLVGLEKKWSVRLTGAGMPSFPNVSSSGKVGQTGFTIAFYIPFNRTEAGRKRGLLPDISGYCTCATNK